MYLKSVEMQGFKSFADKIYLNFNPGITAIVGPNGSGKSNISDAIRWVMGEQSIKSLRGSHMEDVIFSGTEVRKPQGFAEVSLVLDNTERIFPLDYDEVTVTRRVYRSGEGEYFINKNACRLKDVHELFMDTGLGREGYSIVGQGKIDEILSNKSEDRRRIFEETAGITKYKYRKNEAEKKLERTNENLTRISDIMRELEGQLEPLRNQSEKAKKYLNLRDALKNIEVSAAVVSIEKNREDLKTAEKEFNAVNESIECLQKDTAETEEKVNALYTKIAEYDEETEALRAEREQAFEKASEGTNSINLSMANIQHFEENIERINAEKEKSERGIKQLDELIADYEFVLGALKKETDEIADRKSELEKQLREANLMFETELGNVESLKAQIIEKTSEITSVQSKIANSNILIDNFKNESENAERELSVQKGDYDLLLANNRKLKEKFLALEKEVEKCREASKDASDRFKNAAKLADELAEKKNSILAAISQKSSKKSILEDMENDFEGYNRSVKAVMTEHNGGSLKNFKIYGPLSQLVTTSKEYVVAIETAMNTVSQNIVTADEQDAKAAINYLKKNHLGRATFMPISTVKARRVDTLEVAKMDGYIAVAEDLVQCDSLYVGIVGNVLGTTVVADNIDNAIRMASKSGHKFRIVTLEGEVMQPGGAMSGGSSGKNSGFLSRKAELEILEADLLKHKAELEKIEKAIKENTESKEELSGVSEKAQKELMDKNEEYITLKAETEHSDRYLSDADEKRNSLLKVVETASLRIKEINEDIESSEARIKALEQEIIDDRTATEGKQLDTDKILENVNTLRDKIVNVTIEENGKIKDTELQKERLDEILKEKEEILAEISEKNLQIDGFTAKIAEINKEIEENKKSLELISSRTAEADRRIEELLNLRKEADIKTRELQDGIKDVREKLFSLGQQKVKAEAKKTKIEETLDGIFAHLWEEYELTYTEALKVRTDENIKLSEANREIAELKGKIKALGNINIDAIEEYKYVKERFDFLTEQTRDLEKAKGELEGLISEMLEIMQKQFSEQFEHISKSFNSVFRELFGGGQANLTLTDPDDVLGSGVEIEAQPPGKKLQSLTLLSGGERAFTAIALLFAILKVRPTPFCILDEIEAALDDVNVYRYADYLKKYSKKTQFIVVTHRRGTMESANILYGVTMQEKGVSKLLSLNIDEVTE